MPTIDAVLAGLGLTPKETHVYLTLLTLGACPLSSLHKRVQQPRSSVQFTCQQLVEKGFIALSRQKGTVLYVPEPPEKLLLLQDKKVADLERGKQQIQGVLGDMRRLMNPSSYLPSVRYYEGTQGIADAWSTFLDHVPAGDEFLSFAHPVHQVEGDIAQLVQQFIKQRHRKKVRNRVISCDTPFAAQLLDGDAKSLRETRIMKGSCCHMRSAEVMMYGKYLCSVTGEPGSRFATLTEDESIVALQRAAFEALWQRL